MSASSHSFGQYTAVRQEDGHRQELGIYPANMESLSPSLSQTSTRSGQVVSSIHVVPKQDTEVTQNEPRQLFGQTDPRFCKWSIGWTTIAIIVGCYLLAFLTALGNYLFFNYLDGRLVEDSLSQSWVAAMSTAFVRVYSVLLTTSLGTAFAQLLWRRMRLKAHRVSTIDSLMSLTRNPLRLFCWDVLFHAPFLWIFGLLLTLIPIGTVLPPGALVVHSRSRIIHTDVVVPTFDPAYLGNGLWEDFEPSFLFSVLPYPSAYAQPRTPIIRLAKRVLLADDYLTMPSTCGRNCSYNIQFSGPVLKCQSKTFPGLHKVVQAQYPTANATPAFSVGTASAGFGPADIEWRYLGAQQIVNETILGDGSTQYFRFDMQYPMIDSMRTPGGGENISCVTLAANYSVNASFIEDKQTLTWEVFDEPQPLNASLFGNVWFEDAGTDPDPFLKINFTQVDEPMLVPPHGSIPISQAVAGLNIRAISEALTSTLAGAIVGYTNIGFQATNTMLLDSAFLATDSSNYSYLASSLTAAKLEALMQKLAVSTLLLQQRNTTVQATQTFFHTTYVLAHRAYLVVTYAVSLGVALACVVCGLVALLKNGVAADAGGFLQILCTTTGDTKLNRLAGRCCLGGDENVVAELRGLRVRFGEVRGSGGVGAGVTAFGTVEETVEIRKEGRCIYLDHLVTGLGLLRGSFCIAPIPPKTSPMARNPAKRVAKAGGAPAAAKAKPSGPPPPFSTAPAELAPFYEKLDPARIYITHIDRHPADFKKQIFTVPVLLNLAIAALLVWRLYTAGPMYYEMAFAAMGKKNDATVPRAERTWGQLARLTVTRGFMFLLDYVLVTIIGNWPVTFFFERPGNPCTWRWAVGFRNAEIYVRGSRGWGASDLLGEESGSGKRGQDSPFFATRILPAVDRGLVSRKTGYLLMNADWDLDFAGMVRATQLVDAKTLPESAFEKSVWVHAGEDTGWCVWEIYRLDEGAEDEGRKKIVLFKDKLTQMGKESLFFRWIELIQYESSQPGGFTPARQQDAVKKARELFEANGVDFEKFADEVGGLDGMPGLEGSAS
ncbi:uncharacterized protein K452DRAFT_305825 [Aplosporella prunicola CBS 121167]|uniref:Uncharacterized protein n=1 Tax=Aplosporella prunicola CBS 121167 TaxID=1176127 RepID=A0A6A6BL70_9PEZI|nr:uncharacterized protein K452DRAFT_305825 [Aplosporella prunicola CBS 121167]KAF2144859.1 hypothetical protein K452DRAFT_305825 [Aplosporella prunicola CBS 121167]